MSDVATVLSNLKSNKNPDIKTKVGNPAPKTHAKEGDVGAPPPTPKTAATKAATPPVQAEPEVDPEVASTESVDESRRLQQLALDHAKAKKRMRELEKLIEERDGRISEFEQLKKAMSEDKYNFVKDQVGLTYEQWTDHIINGDSSEEKSELSEVLERLNSLEKLETDRKQQLEEQAKAAEEQAQNERYQKALVWAKNYVQNDDRFGLTAALDGSALVVNEFYSHYKEYGEAPNEEEVALRVEKSLEDKIRQQLAILKNLPKFTEIFNSINISNNDEIVDEDNDSEHEDQQQAKKSAAKNKPKSEKNPFKTLSNQHSAISKTTTKPIRGSAKDNAMLDRMGAALRDALAKSKQ